MKLAARSVIGYLIAALTVAGITLVGYRWLHLNATTVALAFLLAVLGISAFYGIREAVFTSVIATLAFNYFFLPPIGTLTIADSRCQQPANGNAERHRNVHPADAPQLEFRRSGGRDSKQSTVHYHD